MRLRPSLAFLLVAVLASSAAGVTWWASGAVSDGADVRGTAKIVDERPVPGLNGTLLEPPAPRPTQVLRDTSGEPFTISGQPVDSLTVLFFGYTHCPDLCPTTMADLAAARVQLAPSLREHVTVAFVSEDPERDSPRALRRWLDGFDESFVGLRGGSRSTAEMLAQLHLSQSKRSEHPRDPIKHPETGSRHRHHGAYGVEHAGVVYAFGPGDSTVIYSGGTTASQYADDFARLLTGGVTPGSRAGSAARPPAGGGHRSRRLWRSSWPARPVQRRRRRRPLERR